MTSLISEQASAEHDSHMNDSPAVCLVCETGPDRVPLISMEYRGGTIRICPQHLPIIIHDPGQLVGLLAGAEDLRPSAHHD
jgi:hypothetical protein